MEILDNNRTYYKTIIKLNNQHIGVNGEHRDLKPGLVVEVDVVLDSRRIYEWLLDPIYSFTKKQS